MLNSFILEKILLPKVNYLRKDYKSSPSFLTNANSTIPSVAHPQNGAYAHFCYIG